ncbi:hypothetical protein FHS87_004548 [Roseomonas pecuniae]|uniref:Uncharacterized protein n=1 Tax=Muricoccus pecuniae TaxID=693023 RepID=A0A840YIS2_9PROT|nr:hypothetical protein [Roseomonas pecuniae]
MADFISESLADIKSETVADFRRNPQQRMISSLLVPSAVRRRT